jgi:hypothetical protein
MWPFVPHDIMFSKFICVIAPVSASFLFFDQIIFHSMGYCILFANSVYGIWVISTSYLYDYYEYSCITFRVNVFLAFLCMYLEVVVALLGQILTICLL